MRILSAFVLAAGVVLAAVHFTPATARDDKDDKEKEKKLMRPDLKSKEWKKLGKKGLEIWEVKEGKGDAVKAAENVKVHYTGWLTDEKGTVFDSSVKRGEPIEFPLDGVIQGWQDGIPGMKVGGVRRLRIPPELAYGKKGAGGLIGPDETLIFEVELLEIK